MTLSPEELAQIREAQKQANKDAMKEWLDDKYASVGRWTVAALCATLLVAVCWFMLEINGWTPPVSIDFVRSAAKK